MRNQEYVSGAVPRCRRGAAAEHLGDAPVGRPLQPFLPGDPPLGDLTAQLLGEHEQRRGLISQRVRRFGRELTEDELMSCHWRYAYNGRYEDIRVLHTTRASTTSRPG
ncbi:MAG: hypothetical protein ACRDRK_06460 [Pseudonocardia sp.]